MQFLATTPAEQRECPRAMVGGIYGIPGSESHSLRHSKSLIAFKLVEKLDQCVPVLSQTLLVQALDFWSGQRKRADCSRFGTREDQWLGRYSGMSCVVFTASIAATKSAVRDYARAEQRARYPGRVTGTTLTLKLTREHYPGTNCARADCGCSRRPMALRAR